MDQGTEAGRMARQLIAIDSVVNLEHRCLLRNNLVADHSMRKRATRIARPCFWRFALIKSNSNRIHPQPIMAPKKRKQQSEPPPDEASIKAADPSATSEPSSNGGAAGWLAWLWRGGAASASSAPSTTTALASGILPPTYVKGFHDEEAVRSMTYRKLGNTGWEVSALSLGASSLGGVFRGVDQDESIDVVVQAVRSGVNLVDTAPWYGQGESERVLGRALKQVIKYMYILQNSQI